MTFHELGDVIQWILKPLKACLTPNLHEIYATDETLGTFAEKLSNWWP